MIRNDQQRDFFGRDMCAEKVAQPVDLRFGARADVMKRDKQTLWRLGATPIGKRREGHRRRLPRNTILTRSLASCARIKTMACVRFGRETSTIRRTAAHAGEIWRQARSMPLERDADRCRSSPGTTDRKREGTR